jgi:multidrug efflux pump subunit AcrB
MIRLSFKNPYLILVFSIIVAVLAGVLIPRMPVDILPKFKKSAMQILTLYPGMPAEVVEKDITSRMERWTGQSPGIEKQLSKSLMGVSIVTNYYGEDVDPAEAMAQYILIRYERHVLPPTRYITAYGATIRSYRFETVDAAYRKQQ